MGWAAVDSQELRAGENALRTVPTQRLLFQHIHIFLLRKDVRPRKLIISLPPPSRLSLVSIDIISSVRGKIDFYKKLLGF
jgi:hypothetical protein